MATENMSQNLEQDNENDEVSGNDESISDNENDSLNQQLNVLAQQINDIEKQISRVVILISFPADQFKSLLKDFISLHEKIKSLYWQKARFGSTDENLGDFLLGDVTYNDYVEIFHNNLRDFFYSAVTSQNYAAAAFIECVDAECFEAVLVKIKEDFDLGDNEKHFDNAVHSHRVVLDYLLHLGRYSNYVSYCTILISSALEEKLSLIEVFHFALDRLIALNAHIENNIIAASDAEKFLERLKKIVCEEKKSDNHWEIAWEKFLSFLLLSPPLQTIEYPYFETTIDFLLRRRKGDLVRKLMGITEPVDNNKVPQSSKRAASGGGAQNPFPSLSSLRHSLPKTQVTDEGHISLSPQPPIQQNNNFYFPLNDMSLQASAVAQGNVFMPGPVTTLQPWKEHLLSATIPSKSMRYHEKFMPEKSILKIKDESRASSRGRPIAKKTLEIIEQGRFFTEICQNRDYKDDLNAVRLYFTSANPSGSINEIIRAASKRKHKLFQVFFVFSTFKNSEEDCKDEGGRRYLPLRLRTLGIQYEYNGLMYEWGAGERYKGVLDLFDFCFFKSYKWEPLPEPVAAQTTTTVTTNSRPQPNSYPTRVNAAPAQFNHQLMQSHTGFFNFNTNTAVSQNNPPNAVVQQAMLPVNQPHPAQTPPGYLPIPQQSVVPQQFTGYINPPMQTQSPDIPPQMPYPSPFSDF